MKNPCVGCGACCAHFRVQFYWREGESGAESGRPPVRTELYEDLDSRYRCMKGTNDKHHPKCAGLKGRIGRDASCSVYQERPTPCREFTASFADGKKNLRCDEARGAHGLRPLTLEDWE
jgi:Fe-S-cluster containining protein